MSTQHTPGPWHSLGPIIHRNGQHIAHVVCDERHQDGERGSAAQRANARLIAQAPAMLQALKGLVSLCYAGDLYGDAILDAVAIFQELGINEIPQHATEATP